MIRDAAEAASRRTNAGAETTKELVDIAAEARKAKASGVVSGATRGTIKGPIKSAARVGRDEEKNGQQQQVPQQPIATPGLVGPLAVCAGLFFVVAVPVAFLAMKSRASRSS
jgi:hypothetical protein